MYHDRVYLCEGQKWDLEREVRKRDYEVQEKWKAATTANNARRKRATVRSHVSFDHFLLRCRPPAPFRVYQTIRASPFSSHGLSLRVVSRSPPIPLSVHTFLFRLLFSLSRCFSWQKTHLRERRFAPGTARTNGKSSHGGDAWKNHWRRHLAILWIFVILISPVSIICSRQSGDDLSFFFFYAIFLRSVTEQSRIIRKGIFSFYVDMKCRNRKNIFVGHIFLLYSFFLSLSFFLSISFFLSRNVPFSTCLFISLRLSSLSG